MEVTSAQSYPVPALTGAAARANAEISERRQKAFKRAQQHSRVVFFLRRVFPVMAVLCVGAYFVTGEFAVQYGDLKASVKKVEITKNELKMTNPRLEGHDAKAGSYLVTADTATQKASSPYVINLKVINGKLEHPQNGVVNLKANDGVFDTKKEELSLKGDLVVTAENGMVARLEQAYIIFKKQEISSDKPVFVEMNSSTIRAERMHMNGLTKELTFTDRVRVKLIKTPDQPVGKKASDTDASTEASGDVVKRN